MNIKPAMIVSILVILAGIVWFYQFAQTSGRSLGEAPLYSDERYDPYGTAAFRDLLVARGNEVVELESPQLETQHAAVLLQVLPRLATDSIRGPSPEISTERLKDWISEGNTVIQFSRFPTSLMQSMRVESTTVPSSDDAAANAEKSERNGDDPEDVPKTVCRAAVDLGNAKGTNLSSELILLWSPMFFSEAQTNLAWKPIARMRPFGDFVVGGEISIGPGKVIIIGAPTPMLNNTVNQAGNLDFLLALIGKSPVIFDRWSLGIGHEPTIIGLIRDVGLMPLLLQAALIALLYVWSTSGFAKRNLAVEPRQRSSIEQIHTLGFLYSRSFSPQITFNKVSAEIKKRISEALRCSPKEISAAATTLNQPMREKIKTLFEKLNKLSSASGPRCRNCGYSLYLLKNNVCPECGAQIPADLLRQISESDPSLPPADRKKQVGFNSGFCDVLTMSHQICREVRNERSARR